MGDEPSGSNRDKVPRERKSRTKLIIEIVSLTIGAIAGLIAIFAYFRPASGRAESQVELVDFEVLKGTDGSECRIKLRNTGELVAFLKTAVINFDDVAVERDPSHYATEVHYLSYDWLITVADLEAKRTEYPLSVQVPGNDVAALSFALGFEQLKSTLTATCRLELHFNEDLVVSTPSFEIVVYNPPGGVPRLSMPKETSEVLRLLESVRSPQLITELIRDLGRRDDFRNSAALLPFFDSPYPSVRREVVSYFDRAGGNAPCRPLVDSLSDEDLDVRAKAHRVLMARGDECLDFLSCLASSGDPRESELVLDILGYLSSPESEAVLLSVLDDQRIAEGVSGRPVPLRALALRSLAKRRSERVKGRLVPLLKDPFDSVIVAAIDTAVACGAVEVVPTLEELAASGSREVSEKALSALEALGG